MPNRWSYVNSVINVDSDVNISNMGLIRNPIQFECVSVNFDCSSNQLTCLEGCLCLIESNLKCTIIKRNAVSLFKLYFIYSR